MIVEFFDDIIFRKEDLEMEFTVVPGDFVRITSDQPCRVFVVRIDVPFGENLVGKGE